MAASAKYREKGVLQQEIERFAWLLRPKISRKRDNGCLRSGRKKHTAKREGDKRRSSCYDANAVTVHDGKARKIEESRLTER